MKQLNKYLIVLDILKLERPPTIFLVSLPIFCSVYEYAHFINVTVEAQKIKEYAQKLQQRSINNTHFSM